MKRIAIVGSSGGHLFVLGGKDPQVLLDEILRQVSGTEIQVSHVAFVAAQSSLDHVTKSTKAALWVMSEGGVKAVFEGFLSETNHPGCCGR